MISKHIHPAERNHFDFIYDNVQASNTFPKECKTCGKVYRDELEFTEETTELPGANNALDFGILQFYRNCKGIQTNTQIGQKGGCDSTLALNLDGRNGNRLKWIKFIEYVEGRAERREDKNFDLAAQNVREEYNKIFLPRKWAEEYMIKNAWAFEGLEEQLNTPLREIHGITLAERDLL